ncbi:hypothetical protein BDZ94DRAFT_1275022 [Collybia nuda]|uniref:Uncharacterized protein n=1 Tax=Collybia nuda TaxID=64659 RepID=A0A9P5XTS1_9AGAR|nr:hypothetical protein BDZ94DRAFT_1275022 [Collybia nuda]
MTLDGKVCSNTSFASKEKIWNNALLQSVSLKTNGRNLSMSTFTHFFMLVFASGPALVNILPTLVVGSPMHWFPLLPWKFRRSSMTGKEITPEVAFASGTKVSKCLSP